MKRSNIEAFSFVELIVATTILIILTSIGFYSFTGSIADSRDTQRMSDIATIETALNLYKQDRGAYPKPGNSFLLLNSGTGVAIQGFLNKNVTLSTLDSIPRDPFIKTYYSYSTTSRRAEYEIAGTLENDDSPKSILSGNYKSVSVNILPTIMLAYSGANIDVNTNKTLFIFNDSKNNYPYTFEDNYDPFTNSTAFADLLSEAQNKDYWQNSDYTSCQEIYESGKSISNTSSSHEYQIVSGGALINTTCDMTSY